MEKVNLNSSLEKLENDYWGIAPIDASGLVKSCYEIRTKRLKDLDENDLRICLGQNIGLTFIVPLVVNILENNPFIETLYYEGDLLKSLLQIESSFWHNNEYLKKSVINIVEKAKKELNNVEDITDETRGELVRTFHSFVL